MNFDGEYIYVIEEREFVKTGEFIYKVGISARIIKRMAEYPLGSHVHMVAKVNDAVKAEKEILQLLKKYNTIIQRKDVGTEYFQGDICTIISVISQVVIMLQGDYADIPLQYDVFDHDIEAEEINTDTCISDTDVVETHIKDEEGSDDMVDKIQDDTNAKESYIDPIVLVHKYIFNIKSELQGTSISAIEFYETMLETINLPRNFKYNSFTTVLKKHKIGEIDTVCGPMIIFPDETEETNQPFTEKNKKKSMIDFVNKHIVKENGSYFTLKQAKQAFIASESFNGKVLSLKNDLLEVLKCVCLDQKKIKRKAEKNVFIGYKIVFHE